MRIDEAAQQQKQLANTSTVQPQKEIAQKREPSDDTSEKVQKTAAAPFLQQIKPQGAGTKVDIFA